MTCVPALYLTNSVIFDFYIILLKRNLDGRIKYNYGQQSYDFDEGLMFFIAPNQVFSFEAEDTYKATGWMLLIHPDFLWHTALAKTIPQYGFFDYAANEVLFLSDKEEAVLNNIINNIRQEYHANIDQFTQSVIISQIETLLNYADRFYHRQFITRKVSSHEILQKLEDHLNQHFNNNLNLPTVQTIAEALNISPNYLSSLLKVITGQSTQQHIHNKLIKKAKEQLSTSALSVSEIAYSLGF